MAGIADREERDKCGQIAPKNPIRNDFQLSQQSECEQGPNECDYAATLFKPKHDLSFSLGAFVEESAFCAHVQRTFCLTMILSQEVLKHQRCDKHSAQPSGLGMPRYEEVSALKGRKCEARKAYAPSGCETMEADYLRLRAKLTG